MSTIDSIEQLLKEKLDATHIRVTDRSAAHARHETRKDVDGGHYILHLVSPQFEGKSSLQRHRLVYEVLAPIARDIHALSMKTLTPGEAENTVKAEQAS